MNLQEIIAEFLDHLRGMWRYRWQAVLAAWVISLLGWYYVYSLPDVYRASAKVSVDTNSLLPDLTKGLTASENLMSEVDVVSKALLTRPNLEAVARETDLDLRANDARAMESLITSLQDRVYVRGGRDHIFTIEFEDRDREKAKEVVRAVLNTFVESSLMAQGEDADMTERALASEIEDHENRLIKAEADLAEFKKQNIGYMPNDGGDYYSRLQTALTSISTTETDIRLLTQKRDEISRQIAGEAPVFGMMSGSGAAGSSSCSQASNMSQLRAQLSELQVEYTDKHPRIVMLRDTIKSLEDNCDAEIRRAAAAGGSGSSMGQSLEANPVYQSLRLQLSNAEVDLAALREELSDKQRTVYRLRTDVDKIAKVETDLKKLNRDYDVVQGRHQELLRRWETLQSKKRLDPVTDQVQFNVLEPPFASAIPVGPDRPTLLMAILFLAAGLSAGLAFALNQLRPVFFTRQTVRRVAGIPVLGSVSMILSPKQISTKRRRTFYWATVNLGLVAATVMVVVFESRMSAIFRNLTAGLGA